MKETGDVISSMQGEKGCGLVGGTSGGGLITLPEEDTSTAVNCDKQGHCLHSATSVGSYYCCKCGKLFYTQNQGWRIEDDTWNRMLLLTEYYQLGRMKCQETRP